MRYVPLSDLLSFISTFFAFKLFVLLQKNAKQNLLLLAEYLDLSSLIQRLNYFSVAGGFW